MAECDCWEGEQASNCYVQHMFLDKWGHISNVQHMSPDEMRHISNVHTHSEVATWQLLDGQRIIQIPSCWRVYAEQPAQARKQVDEPCRHRLFFTCVACDVD